MYYRFTAVLRCVAMNGIGPVTETLWMATAIIQIVLLYLLIARRSVVDFPAFSAYIFVTLAQSGLLFLAIRGWGFTSSVSWRVGWATQFVVLGARAFAVAELCRCILGRFRGVWVLARGLLAISGVVVLLYALLAANHQPRLLLSTAELGLEMAIAAVIVMLLLFARYYEVPVRPPLRWLAVGLCSYSCISALNDTILERWLARYISLWNIFGMVAFLACLLLWTWVFRKAVSQTLAAPMLLDPAVYLKIIPEVNWRLRTLNEQLIQFWHLEAPRS
jgi:hypothetical protein